MGVARYVKEAGVIAALAGLTAGGVYLVRQNRLLLEQNRVLASRAVDPRPGLYLPALQATMLDGSRVVLGELGHRQVLFFFNHTCPFCRASIPAWNAIAAQLSENRDVSVYGVAFDSAAVAATYVTEQGVRFPVLARPEPRLIGLYRVSRVPLVLVIQDGRMAYVRMGVLDTAVAIDSVVAAALRPSMGVKPGTSEGSRAQRSQD